jgi:TonB family protein
MLAATHWYHSYPRNLRRSYYIILGLSWFIVLFIIGYTKYSAIRAERRALATQNEGTIIMPTDTLRYSDMQPPPSLNSDQIVAAAALPDATPASVEAATNTVPLPVPDELAEATTMTPQKTIAGVAAPAATGSGAPVFILPETTHAYDDNKPAPATFKYMTAAVMPTPLHDVQPEYPDKARALSIEGTVMVDMWLRKDGSVSQVQIYKSAHPLLDSAAARAAAKSTFTPARGADGAPVNVWVRRPFRFSLSGGQR